MSFSNTMLHMNHIRTDNDVTIVCQSAEVRKWLPIVNGVLERVMSSAELWRVGSGGGANVAGYKASPDVPQILVYLKFTLLTEGALYTKYVEKVNLFYHPDFTALAPQDPQRFPVYL